MKIYKMVGVSIITILLTIPFLAYSSSMKLRSERLAQEIIEIEKASSENQNSNLDKEYRKITPMPEGGLSFQDQEDEKNEESDESTG